MPKLIAVGIQYVAYVLVDDDPGEALNVVNAAICNVEDPLPPIDKHTLEVLSERDISVDWAEQTPWVAPSVTDGAFEAMTKDGSTVKDILRQLRK